MYALFEYTHFTFHTKKTIPPPFVQGGIHIFGLKDGQRPLLILTHITFLLEKIFNFEVQVQSCSFHTFDHAIRQLSSSFAGILRGKHTFRCKLILESFP